MPKARIGTTAIVLAIAALGSGLLSLLALSGAFGCALAIDSAPCTRVLFIGNSYTFVNDLPNTFAQLARSGGHRIEVGMAAEGGWTLAQHEASPETAADLSSSRWNFVVLQEQSEIPSIPSMRESEMYPAAGNLVTAIRKNDSQPIFFETWAHQTGWPQNGLPDYASMQRAIDDGYHTVAADQGAALAPVGEAWQAAIGRTHSSLWQDDGSHPTVAGTYLAACVFYAVIFDQSPVGLDYRDGLPSDDAATLQSIAAKTVG
jgi:hypothetical protein